MNQQLETALWQAAARTFEEFSFLFPNPQTSQCDNPPYAAAIIHFHGLFEGTLEITASAELLPVLACNMLGTDETPTANLQRDALGEIANVVCGNFLPDLAGTQAVFQIEAPQVVTGPDVVRQQGMPTTRLKLSFDEGESEIRLFLNQS